MTKNGKPDQKGGSEGEGVSNDTPQIKQESMGSKEPPGSVSSTAPQLEAISEASKSNPPLGDRPGVPPCLPLTFIKRYCSITNTQPVAVVSLLITVIFGLIAILIALGAFQILSLRGFVKSEKEQIAQDFIRLKEEMKKSIYEVIKSDYIAKVNMQALDIKCDNPQVIDKAIWRLIGLLNEIAAKQPELYRNDIDKLYAGFLRDLDIKLDITAKNATQANYRDSYRGRVWIWVLLIKSGNENIKILMREELYGKKADEVLHMLDKAKEYQKEINNDEISDLTEGVAQLKPLLQGLLK
jgi:hypothetical protein